MATRRSSRATAQASKAPKGGFDSVQELPRRFSGESTIGRQEGITPQASKASKAPSHQPSQSHRSRQPSQSHRSSRRPSVAGASGMERAVSNASRAPTMRSEASTRFPGPTSGSFASHVKLDTPHPKKDILERGNGDQSHHTSSRASSRAPPPSSYKGPTSSHHQSSRAPSRRSSTKDTSTSKTAKALEWVTGSSATAKSSKHSSRHSEVDDLDSQLSDMTIRQEDYQKGSTRRGSTVRHTEDHTKGSTRRGSLISRVSSHLSGTTRQESSRSRAPSMMSSRGGAMVPFEQMSSRSHSRRPSEASFAGHNSLFQSIMSEHESRSHSRQLSEDPFMSGSRAMMPSSHHPSCPNAGAMMGPGMPGSHGSGGGPSFGIAIAIHGPVTADIRSVRIDRNGEKVFTEAHIKGGH